MFPALVLYTLDEAGTSQGSDVQQGYYKDQNATQEMQDCLVSVRREESYTRIRQSSYTGLMIDESLDVVVQKKMILCVRIAEDEGGKVEARANIERNDREAETIVSAVLELFWQGPDTVSVYLEFGMDGATVMIRKNSSFLFHFNRWMESW